MMKKLAPGVYDDGNGGLHFDAAEVLEANGYPDTPENRAVFLKAAREVFPGIIETDEPIEDEGERRR